MGNTYDIVGKKPLTLSEVKEEVFNKEEPNYRESKVLDYLKKRDIVELSNVRKLRDELKGLGINRLDDEDVVKIINIMPKTGTELRAIVSSTGTILVDESVTKILEVLNKYRE